jgi:hypothetical protein
VTPTLNILRVRTGGLLVVGSLVFLLAASWGFRQLALRFWSDEQRPGQPDHSQILVKAKGDFQKALTLARPGDTIILEAGAVFTGPFKLPAKTGAEYVTIQSSRLAELPGPANRVKPSHASLMPRLVSPGLNQSVVLTAPSAHHYRFIGIEFAPVNATAVISTLVQFGDSSSAQNSLGRVPHDLIIDRCYIHGFPTQDVQRGVALNSGETSIINSYISEIHGIGYDTQAICGWNGPGPYHVINNYLAAAGENVMFGGADPTIANLVPSEIEIRRNYFFKPLSWKVGDPSYAGKHWTVKNLFELKNARRVVVEGNLFENCWVDAQEGFAIVLKSQNQDGGCPWCVSEDVIFSNNIVRNAEHGLNILAYDPYHPSGQLKHISVTNNLWDNITGMWFQGTAGADGILLEHNTHLQQSGNVMTLYGPPTTRFVVRNNLGARTGYGVKGDGTGEGTEALTAFCPSYVFQKNILAGAEASQYPAGNFYPATLNEVKFVDSANRNYRLAVTSRYKNAGTDRRDIGVDFAALIDAAASQQQ